MASAVPQPKVRVCRGMVGPLDATYHDTGWGVPSHDDPGIIRNRLKVEGALKNARAFLEARAEHGSFDRSSWSFMGGGTLARPAPPPW